jgi:hypothetical protein
MQNEKCRMKKRNCSGHFLTGFAGLTGFWQDGILR